MHSYTHNILSTEFLEKIEEFANFVYIIITNSWRLKKNLRAIAKVFKFKQYIELYSAENIHEVSIYADVYMSWWLLMKNIMLLETKLEIWRRYHYVVVIFCCILCFILFSFKLYSPNVDLENYWCAHSAEHIFFAHEFRDDSIETIFLWWLITLVSFKRLKISEINSAKFMQINWESKKCERNAQAPELRIPFIIWMAYTHAPSVGPLLFVQLTIDMAVCYVVLWLR